MNCTSWFGAKRHSWLPVAVRHYIDISYNGEAPSTMVIMRCTKCNEIDKKSLYGSGHISLQEITKDMTGQNIGEMDWLEKALQRYDILLESIEGCTNGGCVIRIPKGMHTNGQCHCLTDHRKMYRFTLASNELRQAIKTNTGK